MNKQLKLSLLASLIALSVSACNSGGQTNGTNSDQALNKTANNLKQDNIFPSGKVISLGSPYSKSNNNTLIAPFPVNALEDSTPVNVGAMKSGIVYTATDDISQVINKLGIGGSLSGASSVFDGSIAADYLNSNSTKKHTVSFFYSYDYSFPVSLMDSKMPAEFIDGKPDEKYGDSFVSTVEMGLYAGAHIEISSDSESAINLLQVALAGKYSESANESGNQVKLRAALDMLDENTKSKLSTSIKIVQLGGDTTKLSKYINIIPDGKTNSSEDDQERELSKQCGISDLAKCLELLNSFEQYGSTELAQEAKSRMSSLIDQNDVTWGQVKSLYPFDNNKVFAVSGSYFDKDDKDEKIFPTPARDTTTKIALANAEVAYTELENLEKRINNLAAATLFQWNGAKINDARNKIQGVKSKFVSAVKGYCLSTVVTKNSAMSCKTQLNKILNNDVNPAKSDAQNLFNELKGFPIHTSYVDGTLVTTYFIPSGNNVFITPIPFKIDASVYPTGPWAITKDINTGKSYLNSPSAAAWENNPVLKVVNPKLMSNYLTKGNSLEISVQEGFFDPTEKVYQAIGQLYNDRSTPQDIAWSGGLQVIPLR